MGFILSVGVFLLSNSQRAVFSLTEMGVSRISGRLPPVQFRIPYRCHFVRVLTQGNTPEAEKYERRFILILNDPKSKGLTLSHFVNM